MDETASRRASGRRYEDSTASSGRWSFTPQEGLGQGQALPRAFLCTLSFRGAFGSVSVFGFSLANRGRIALRKQKAVANPVRILPAFAVLCTQEPPKVPQRFRVLCHLQPGQLPLGQEGLRGLPRSGRGYLAGEHPEFALSTVQVVVASSTTNPWDRGSVSPLKLVQIF